MIKKIYFYLYYKIYRFGKSLSDDALNSWKPLIVICLLQLFVIISIDLWLIILFRKSYFLEQANIILWVICVGLAVINYYIFLGQDNWKFYSKEFIKYSRKRNFIGSLLVIGVITGIVFLLLFSFYKLSQIKH